jgi:mannose-6-phosphate isomerase-like protein (cupin superfamily)
MLIKSNQMTTEVRENMRGGAGKASMAHIAKGEDLPKNVRLSAVLTLEPGCSIGWHVHEKETEIFYFVAGSGSVNDNGTTVAVTAGDCLITPDGCGHSVENNGSEALVFFAVIVLN